MPTAQPTCATHTAVVYERGGTTVVGELTGVFDVEWNRVRDDISQARVQFVVEGCCEVANLLATVRQELHLFRNGVPVWQGPITRLEFEAEFVEVYAEDILWVAKKRAMSRGYNYHFGVGNIGSQSTINHILWLLNSQCFNQYGDQWQMQGYLYPVEGPDDVTMSRSVNAWSQSVWEDIDYSAQYHGIDYTVVNRSIFWWDTHLDWAPIDALDEAWLQKFPRIVEYGNDYGNRYVRTDGSSYAGVAVAPPAELAQFSEYIDIIANEVDQTGPALPDGSLGLTGHEVPTDKELDSWARSAASRVEDSYPARTAIMIPANTTLLPNTTWDVNTLMAGSWFLVDIERQCRQISEYQKLNEIKVSEDGVTGETVAISSQSAPSRRVVP